MASVHLTTHTIIANMHRAAVAFRPRHNYRLLATYCQNATFPRIAQSVLRQSFAGIADLQLIQLTLTSFNFQNNKID